MDVSWPWKSVGRTHKEGLDVGWVTSIGYCGKVLGDTQGQAPELILVPCLCAKVRFLSFNRTQSRAVTGLLTGHNTLRRNLHLYRRCGAQDETSAHILCECEDLLSHRHAYLLGARGH